MDSTSATGSDPKSTERQTPQEPGTLSVEHKKSKNTKPAQPETLNLKFDDMYVS